MIASNVTSARALAVFLVNGTISDAVRHHLSSLDIIWVSRPDQADVVLAGPDGAPDGEIPVVTLGGTQGAGQLPRDAGEGQIEAALRAMAAGLVVRAPGAAPAFRPLADPVLADLLTPRELEVLKAMGEGGSNKQIARQLDISLHTVKFYVEAVFRKLDAHSRAEAVAKGLRRQRRETVEL